MEKTMNVAVYIANKFLSTYGQKIDEMKLHKLMYFAQRESFIRKNELLFPATFYWKLYKESMVKDKNATLRSNYLSDSDQDKTFL